MKKINILLTMLLMLATWSCRTKKSTTDFKQSETEKIGISDYSVVKKNLTTEEKTDISKTETTADKSFFEAWMSFESDKITITDKNGTVTEITKPKINKKSLQTNDVKQSDQIAVKKEKATKINENQQNNVALSNNRQIKTDVQQKQSSKGKEPFWLWIVGGCVVGGVGYFVLKRFGLV